MITPKSTSKLKLLAVMEATTITGAARSMLEFCRAARDFQHTLPDRLSIEVSLATFERRRSATAIAPGATEGNVESHQFPPNEFVAAARELGIEVDLIGERFRFDPRVIPQLRRIVEERAPDIVVTHHVKSHFLLNRSRLWRQVPWAAFHHGYTTTDLKMRAYNYLDQWSLPTAHRVITVCEAFARELAGKGVSPEKISVQHNSIRVEPTVNPEETRALRIRLGIQDDERLVIVIGRLSREKAQIDLLPAFASLQSSHPELKAKLLMIGDGPERGALEAAAGSLGINKHVIFAGQLSNVSSYYSAADVMALPSHSEGSPYALLEAMAAGLPVVATTVGGVPEMVEDGKSALLVEARDARAMAEALYRVLTNQELARGLATEAAALVATRYSPDTYLHSLVNIYRQAISSATLKS